MFQCDTQWTYLMHTFKYPRSQIMWLTLPLLIERLSAICRHVMCQSSGIKASACCSISGLTTVQRQRQQGKICSSAFLFQKLSFSSPSNQQCFCWTQHFHKRFKGICGLLSLTLSQQQGILSEHIVCTVHHWWTPLWGNPGVVLPVSIFTTLYINAVNFKSVLSKISYA
jgi:hypothetical protein